MQIALKTTEKSCILQSAANSPYQHGIFNYKHFINMQTWSSRDLGLGLETSRDRNLKVLVLVLFFWQLNIDFVLRWILSFVISSRHHLSTKLIPDAFAAKTVQLH